MVEDIYVQYICWGSDILASFYLMLYSRVEYVVTHGIASSINGEKVVMLTGDSSRVAKRVARELEVDEVKAQVLLEDKAAFIEEEHAAGRTCIMIGDGVNDSPSAYDDRAAS